jgi:hypothetical protein
MKYLYHILASLPQRWTHLVNANTIIGGEVVNVAMHVTQISLKWHAYDKVFGKQYVIWFKVAHLLDKPIKYQQQNVY